MYNEKQGKILYHRAIRKGTVQNVLISKKCHSIMKYATWKFGNFKL